MPNVHEITPRKERETNVGRAMRPFTHSMEEFFENFLPRRWMEDFFEPYATKRPSWSEFEGRFEGSTKVDIIDKGDALMVRAELPGVEKEDLDVLIAGDRLTIEAKREFKEEEKEDTFFWNEMAYGRLYRAVHLPVEVISDKAKAELKNGMLEIYLPKVKAVTPHTVKVA